MLKRLRESTFNTFVKLREAVRKPTYPPDHIPAMQVPKGGSSCKTCRFLGPDEKTCKNKYYTLWNGSNRLLKNYDEFCSDWYEPKNSK